MTIHDYTEHKISISNYKQLVGLYDVLELMKTKCKLNTISGCHIHVNMSNIALNLGIYHPYIQTFFNKKIQNGTIEKIFDYNLCYPYTGKYPRICCTDSKNSWINIRTDLHSVEFRIAPMTFDYNLIISWFIKLNKLVNELENNLKLQRRESKRVGIYEAC
jgi:hypothetical protein